MGLRLTSGENVVAMFDSVSGWAFGPTFADEDEARDFIEWGTAHYGGDLRCASDTELASTYSAWWNARTTV